MHDAVPGKHALDGDTNGMSETGMAPTRPSPDMDTVGLALDAGQVGVWSWDITSNAVAWSGNFAQIHGFADGAFDGSFATIQQSIHPEDQPEVTASIQESLRTGKPYRAQYRLAPAQ